MVRTNLIPRFAKIVATIGPASQDEVMISHLIQAGMNVARLNFSHGTHDDHSIVYQRLRETSRRLQKPVTIIQDLQGPKIRTGELENGQVELKPGQKFILTSKKVLGNDQIVSVDFVDLPRSVRKGGRILLDDGNLELAVTNIEEHQVETRVVLGGILKPHKGVNLPGANLDIPSLTEKDLEDLAFGIKLGVDAVAISFVRSPKDISGVKHAISRLSQENRTIPVIAKLERPEALDNLEKILEIADGVMVARGDLGVEMPAESVPIAQKRIIETANQYGKVVITATQMLDSMINNPRPTRAEASDVANAIFDGTDAVMLSGETAAGKYPIQTVEVMNAIICKAESHMAEWGNCRTVPSKNIDSDDTYFMTQAARELAHDRNVAAIAVFTKSGRTARMMSKTRPEVPILAFTPEPDTYQRLSLYWGVVPRLVPHVNTIEEMLAAVENNMLATTPIQPKQQIVLICGFPVHAVRPTNMALLHTVGDDISF
jgi:pyruvate kinase